MGWISVKDRLPEGIGDVLLLTTSKVCTIGDWYCLAWRTQNDMWHERDGWRPSYKNDDITHWMPLPEPPKYDHYRDNECNHCDCITECRKP